MIAHINGKLISKEPFTLVIEAGGIGYEIYSTQEAYNRAPQVGADYLLHTRHIVREDSETLYGFASVEERKLFDQVISVSGIGPKTGLSIVSALGAEALREAIRTSDLIALKGIPGVGKKTAERLIVKLRDKMIRDDDAFDIPSASGGSAKIRQEALAALLALGYSRADGEKAIRTVVKDDPKSAEKIETLLKAALRSF